MGALLSIDTSTNFSPNLRGKTGKQDIYHSALVFSAYGHFLDILDDDAR